jgi:7-carboxy-7-deazaguanine synthase
LKTIKNKDNQLRINEIFFRIQGESSYAGLPCVFVRLTYCNLRCSYCDTEYAFYEGQWRRFDDIIHEVKKYKCRLVEITGGEPLLQENILPFMSRLCDEGFDVLIETGGHMSIENVDARVKRIMDIKCPSSNESDKIYWPNIEQLNSNDQVKFVVGNLDDYQFCKEIIAKYNLDKKCMILLSPVFETLNPQELAEWILKDNLPVRMQLQMHKFIWQPETRGV